MNPIKTPRRTVLIVLATIVILIGGAYVGIHTRPVERFIRAQAIHAARARTGAQIEIGRIAIHWTNVGADVYGITVYGTGGKSQPPLFECPRLEIELDIASLLRGRVGIAKLLLDRPLVHFTVNDRGQTNLPEAPAVEKPSLPAHPLFALGIGQVAIHDAHIDYNNARIPLSAELANFELRIIHDTHRNEYKGFLRYDHGRIAFQNSHPVENNLQAHFVVSRSGLTVDPLRASLQGSRLTLQAELTGFAHPDIRASYELALDTPEIARIIKSAWLPAGEIRTKGTMRYRDTAGPSWFDRVQADGRFSSPRLAVHAGPVRAVATSARGAYTLERGNLRVADLQANVLGGLLRVESGELSLTGQSPSRLNVTWQHVSLRELSAMLLPAKDRSFHVVGRADGNAGISWPNDIRHLAVRSRIDLHGQAELAASVRQVPLNAVVDARYDGAQGRIRFHPSFLQLGQTKLSLNGQLSKKSDLSVMLQAGDLHAFSDAVIQAGKVAKFGRIASLAPLGLEGSARFSGRVLGSLQNPRLQGRLSARDVQVEGTRWQSIAANVNLSPSEIALQNGIIRASGSGRLRLDGTAGLRNWSLDPASPVSLRASATNLSLATIEKLAKVNYPVSGLLSARLSVQGTGRHPSGNGTVRMAQVSAWNQPIQLITIDFRGNGSAIQSTATVQTAAGVLHADLRYIPQTMEYELAAHSSGIRLDRVRALEAAHSGIQGTLAVSVSGRGTLTNPELSAILTTSQLQVRGQPIPNAQAKLDIARHRAQFTAQMAVDRGTAQAEGSVALTGEYDARAALDVHAPSLGTVLARYWKGSPSGLKGQADLHAEISGPLKNPSRIEYHVELPTLHLAYGGIEIALAEPLRLDYRAGVATLARTELKGTNMDFTLQGTLPVGQPAPMNVAIDGTVDLGLLQAVTRGIGSSGRLTIRLTAGGPLSHPTIEGSIRVENAAFSSDSIPLNLGGVNGQLHLSGDRIEIRNLTGRLGGGAMSAQGFLIYRKQPIFNLALQAKSVGLRYPQGIVTMLDANLRFAGTRANSALSGRILIDRMALTKQFQLATLANQLSPGPAPATASSFERHARLNVTVQSAQTLRLASSQLGVQGSADLRVTGTLANPVVLGRATIAEGEIFFLNRRYEIQNGTVEFTDPVRNNPVLNIYATTTARQYKITMNFAGPLDRLRMNYTSDPPLPSLDIINLLAFGKTSAQAAAGPAAPPVLGAEAVLAKTIASQFTGKIQKLAGISQLTINPLIGSSQQGLGAEIAIQQRVTGRLLLTFSTNTARGQDAAIQVQYEASHSISVSGLRDQNGGYAVDVHFHKSF
ncbi:MAG TPA: translocation/assembly module TamB domain-containing protein [Patescibacteria group bacterium]|nr:translocation/assembly module TamB domain-containing protein [Patescibacteria group bacterium]